MTKGSLLDEFRALQREYRYGRWIHLATLILLVVFEVELSHFKTSSHHLNPSHREFIRRRLFMCAEVREV